MSTDALAVAQLELLYRLGVLEREQPTSSPIMSTSSVRRPQHVPTVDAGERAGLDDDALDGEALRFASQVHLHHYVKRFGGGNADYGMYGEQYNTRVTPLNTVSRARAYGSIGTSPRSVNNKEERSFAAQPLYLRRSSHSHRSAETPHKRKSRHKEAPRTWFLYWKLFVRNAREKASMRAIWVFHVKKHSFAAWNSKIQCQKRLATQHRAVIEWKARRAARRWCRWVKNRQRIQFLIGNSRFSLINRLRKRRVWLRWLRFAAQSCKWNAILRIRFKIRNQRLVRVTWRELKVFACRRRQDRRGLRKFLHALQAYRASEVVKRSAVLENQLALRINTKRRLMIKWKQFVASRVSTRRTQHQAAFRISRKRYFRIWWECMRDNQCIAQFKTRRTQVSVHQHFVAWSFAAKVVQMARKKSVKTCKGTRERFFQAWKREIQFRIRYQDAAQEFERWKLSKTLTRMSVWVHQMRSQRQTEDVWRKRVLERVWRLGFLKFHQLQQDAKAEIKSLELQVQRDHFAEWVGFWRTRMRRRAVIRTAAGLSLRNRFRRAFARWRQHWRQRNADNERLENGARYYYSRLMQSGVYKLSLLVSQRSENAERSVQIRRHARLLMKARYCREWKRWTRRKQEEKSCLAWFHERERYLQSWFNPYRRVWSSWQEFAKSSTRIQHVEGVYQTTLKRKCIHGWKRRAHLGRAISNFQRLMVEETLEKSFSAWRSRTSHWLKMREVFTLARAVYRHKRCGKILWYWSQWAKKAVRVKMKQQQLEELTRLKTLESCFQYWNVQFYQRSKAFHHAANRQASWKARCLREWLRYIVKRVKLKRKFTYFQLVFGKYPTTSLVRRNWLRWTRYTRTSRSAKSLRNRQHYQIVRQSWKQWKFFHLYNLVFRRWHCVAVYNAFESAQFGKRLRFFYDSRRHLLKTRMFSEWKIVFRRKKSEREALLSVKHLTLRAIVSRSIQHAQAHAKYLKKWFSRWHNRVHARCNAAKYYYEAKLARRVLIVWWRLMVNAKQELVLSEAKHVLGSLSFYHPQQQLYTQVMKEKALQSQAAKATHRESQIPRETKMKTMRRMLDPEEKRKYAIAARLEHGRVRYNTTEMNGEGRTIDESSRRVKFQASDQDITKSTSHKVHQKEPKTLRLVKRIPQRVRFCEQSSKIESDPSRDLREHQHVEQRAHQMVCSRKKELMVVAELPLFDSPTLPRQQKVNELYSCQIEEEMKTQQPHCRADRSMVLKSTSTSLAKADCPVLSLYDEAMHPNGNSLAPSSYTKQNQRNLEKNPPPTFHDRDHQADASPNATALDATLSSTLPPPETRYRQSPRFEDPRVNPSDSSGEISLEQLASMELYSKPSPPLKESRPLNSVHPLPQHDFSTPYLPTKYQRRQKQAEDKVLPLPSKLSEEISLSAILELPVKHKQNTDEATKTGTIQAGESIIQELNPSDILNEILDHYARYLVDFPAEKGSELSAKDGCKTDRHKQICFRMVRDLGLFHNQFYFPQMESILDSINTKHIAVARKQVKAPLDDGDKEYLHHLKVEYLKRFLTAVIGAHPLYNATLKENGLQRYQAASMVEDERLQWFVQVHLQPWIPAQMSRQSRRKLFWIQSSLPREVESALEKLLLCVCKHFKVLVQLFSTRVSEPNRKEKQQRNSFQQMTKFEFTQLLKQVRVFPQLLNKRELESAFDASCCFVPDQKEINFPEFIEALIRCSANLQWGEISLKNGNSTSETGVVVKFLMLLFAMEGKGSVLQKRNEDLQVVLRYLEQQQLEKKTGKMHRFRKLLADQKHQRGQQVRGQHPKHPDRSTRWRSLHRPSKSASPRRGGGAYTSEDDTDLFYCGEAGVLLHPSSDMVYNPSGINSFDLMVGENSSHFLDAVLPATHGNYGDTSELNYPSELASPPGTEDERSRFLRSPKSESLRCVGIDMGQQGFPGNPADSSEGNGGYELSMVGPDSSAMTPTCTREAKLVQSESAASPVDDHAIPDTSCNDNVALKDAITVTADKAPSPSANSYRIGELQDENDFLNEILSSIGDVELVLQQSNLQLHGRASSEDLQRKAKSVDEYSDDFESESADNLTSDSVMRALFTTTGSSTILHMDVNNSSDEQLLSDQVEDIHVNDPMLDQLTRIERFADSAGRVVHWRAYPTLEDIAELGVHAVALSSIYQVTSVQDTELNDMTTSKFGAHYCGGFSDDKDASENHDGV